MEHILKKVYGVELASQKIELGLIDDVKNIANRLKILDNVLSKNGQEVQNLLGDFTVLQSKIKDRFIQVEMDAEDAESDIKEAVKIIDKVSATAKDLGIDPKSIKGTDEIVKYTESLEYIIKRVKDFDSEVKKILSI